MSELTERAFWQDVDPGDLVVLSDAQAMVEALRQGLDGSGGLNYEVRRVLRIEELSGLAEWSLLELAGADQVWLMAKMSGDQVDLRVYFEVPEFPAGNRADLLEAEMHWLFEDPGPDWNSRYTELRFTSTITIDQGGENDEPTSTSYRLKPFGAQYGSLREQPEIPGATLRPATVIEYLAGVETENPELLLLELGGEDAPEGGFIMMMLGCPVAPTDVKIFKQ